MLPKILNGIQVADFSRLLPGPFASSLLQKMGARIQCILPPVGDPLLGAYSPFEEVKAGKEFTTLDLKKAEEFSAARKIIEASPILLEGFRPGTMQRLGLGFETVRQWRPDVLYVSLVGYPEGHPRYQDAAHDLNFLVDSGLYSLLFADDSSEIPLIQLADLLGGFSTAFHILAEWMARGVKPEAKHLQVSIVEALQQLGHYLQTDSIGTLEPWLTGGLARYNIYRSKDGKRIAVAALEPKFFRNLVAAMGISLSGSETEAEITDKFRKVFSEKNLEEWREQFLEVDACVSFIPLRAEVLVLKPR